MKVRTSAVLFAALFLLLLATRATYADGWKAGDKVLDEIVHYIRQDYFWTVDPAWCRARIKASGTLKACLPEGYSRYVPPPSPEPSQSKPSSIAPPNAPLVATAQQTFLSNSSVEWHFLIDRNGYIKIKDFFEVGPDEVTVPSAVVMALEKLLCPSDGGAPAKGVVLDLRGNPGGATPYVSGILKQFMEKGMRFLYFVDAHGRTVKHNDIEGVAINNGPFVGLPLVVVQDDATASSAEIASGVTQKNLGATVVGQPSWGKNLVQVYCPLSNGGTLWLVEEQWRFDDRTAIKDRQDKYHGVQPNVSLPEGLSEDEIVGRAMEILQQKIAAL